MRQQACCNRQRLPHPGSGASCAAASAALLTTVCTTGCLLASTASGSAATASARLPSPLSATPACARRAAALWGLEGRVRQHQLHHHVSRLAAAQAANQVLYSWLLQAPAAGPGQRHQGVQQRSKVCPPQVGSSCCGRAEEQQEAEPGSVGLRRCRGRQGIQALPHCTALQYRGKGLKSNVLLVLRVPQVLPQPGRRQHALQLIRQTLQGKVGAKKR